MTIIVSLFVTHHILVSIVGAEQANLVSRLVHPEEAQTPMCSFNQIHLSSVQLAAHLCNFVYEKPQRTHERIISSYGIHQVVIWNIEASFREVVGRVWLFNNRTLFVVLRGTASMTDGFINSRFYRSKDFSAMGKVHAGFVARFRKIQKQIENIIDSNALQFDRIVFAGHSLGGAVAMLAALNYSVDHAKVPIDVVTLGSPRVGDETFGKYFNFYIKSHTRVFVSDDPVVTLPPRFMGYEHVVGGCVLMLPHATVKKGLFDKLEAHSLVIYQTNLEHLSQ